MIAVDNLKNGLKNLKMPRDDRGKNSTVYLLSESNIRLHITEFSTVFSPILSKSKFVIFDRIDQTSVPIFPPCIPNFQSFPRFFSPYITVFPTCLAPGN